MPVLLILQIFLAQPVLAGGRTPSTPSPAAPFTAWLTGNPGDALRKPLGGFLLVGGGEDPAPAFRWFIRRAAHGDILVLRAAGADGYNSWLRGLGPVDSVETILCHSRAASDDPYVVQRLREAEGIFLAGGDQWPYVSYWQDSPIARELQAAAARGAVIGGTSAGLAVLGEFVFTARHDTITTPEALADPGDRRMCVEPGPFRFPLLANVLTDTHFSPRDRLGRLIAFLARLRADGLATAPRGCGVDEATAILLEPDGRAQVVGSGSVFLAELAGPARCHAGLPLWVTAVGVVGLPAGSRFTWGNPLRRLGPVERLEIRSGMVIRR
ncbi:MAG: cyanophycinase [Candidatus Riflebacteria bacterium]|nr:cyanophycinase [Candidatus Riflebacteria bacterium]